MNRATRMAAYALIPVTLLLVGPFTACDDDEGDSSAPVSTHAAVHDLAHDACESLERADASEAQGIYDDLVAEVADLGEPESEARAVMIEECQELVDQFGF